MLGTELAYMRLVFQVKLAITGEMDIRRRSVVGKNSGPLDSVEDRRRDEGESNRLAEGGRAWSIAFLKEQPEFFHYYEAMNWQVIPLVWLGNVEQNPSRFGAATTLHEIAMAPLPDFRARVDLAACSLVGIAGKYEDAMPLTIRASVKASVHFRRIANAIGRDRLHGCLRWHKECPRRSEILQDTIAKADDDDTILLARPIFARGNRYCVLNDNQQALWRGSCACT